MLSEFFAALGVLMHVLWWLAVVLLGLFLATIVIAAPIVWLTTRFTAPPPD